MAYTIEFATRAIADLDVIVGYITADSPKTATQWRKRLLTQIHSLKRFPNRCGLAPESAISSMEIRQFVFGFYRILYVVVESQSKVIVLTIRHSSRRFLTPTETSGLLPEQD